MQPANNRQLMFSMVATLALGYITMRYRWLRPFRRFIPGIMVAGAWWMNRNKKQGGTRRVSRTRA
jgi:hypothetical protein